MLTKHYITASEASQIYFKYEQVLLATEVSPHLVGLIMKIAEELKLLLTSKYHYLNDQQQKEQVSQMSGVLNGKKKIMAKYLPATVMSSHGN